MSRRKILLSSEDFSEKDLINLTPLIDVIFIVLIAFILIAPLLEIDSVQLAVSSSKKTQKLLAEPEALKVTVRSDNTIWIHEKSFTLPELQALLEKENLKKEIYLYHDRKAYFETYQQIKNIAEQTGFDTIKVVLKSS